MSFSENIMGMFGVDPNQYNDIPTPDEAVKEQYELREVTTFFESTSGKKLLEIFNNEIEALRDQLEDVSDKNLLKTQADLRALKFFVNTIEDIGKEIKTYEKISEILQKA